LAEAWRRRDSGRGSNHVFVKYRDDEGKFINLETTSGAGFTRDEWMRQQFPMTDEAIASGIYMRPLTKKETVAIMVGTLLEFYDRQGMQDQRIALAKVAMEYSEGRVAHPSQASGLLREVEAGFHEQVPDAQRRSRWRSAPCSWSTKGA